LWYVALSHTSTDLVLRAGSKKFSTQKITNTVSAVPSYIKGATKSWLLSLAATIELLLYLLPDIAVTTLWPLGDLAYGL
jgi:uncharacterized membrane protein YhaH (DUF805 family)